MIIDFHTHCFPSPLASRAIASISKEGGALPPQHDGTLDSLLCASHAAGVDRVVLLHIATNPKQQENVNNFAIATNQHPDVIAFGSVHPDSPNAFRQLERLKEAGIQGIKLHPDYQNFFVDDKKLAPLYRRIAELGLVTVFHAGCDIGLPDPIHCTPERLASVLPLFDGAPVVAAHFGGYLLWRDVLQHLKNSSVYLDTSYSHTHMPPDWAREIIEAFGAQRILFGSDMPWSSMRGNIDFIRSLSLSQAQLDLIFHQNASRILSLS